MLFIVCRKKKEKTTYLIIRFLKFDVVLEDLITLGKKIKDSDNG